jgi:hypothetical protein
LRHWAGFVGACLVWVIGRAVIAKRPKPLGA